MSPRKVRKHCNMLGGGTERRKKNTFFVLFRARYYGNTASYEVGKRIESEKFSSGSKVANFVRETYNSYFSRPGYDSWLADG
jgi:hypothetical protein